MVWWLRRLVDRQSETLAKSKQRLALTSESVAKFVQLDSGPSQEALKDAIKEAVDAAIEEKVEPVTSELGEFKEGLNKIVGSSKSIVGQDDERQEGTPPSIRDRGYRDGWGRKRYR